MVELKIKDLSDIKCYNNEKVSIFIFTEKNSYKQRVLINVDDKGYVEIESSLASGHGSKTITNFTLPDQSTGKILMDKDYSVIEFKYNDFEMLTKAYFMLDSITFEELPKDVYILSSFYKHSENPFQYLIFIRSKYYNEERVFLYDSSGYEDEDEYKEYKIENYAMYRDGGTTTADLILNNKIHKYYRPTAFKKGLNSTLNGTQLIDMINDPDNFKFMDNVLENIDDSITIIRKTKIN